MDETVNARRRLAAVLLVGLLGASAQARQSVADPTRPPPEAGLRAGEDLPSAPAQPVLQSVLISRKEGGRMVAVIDGETVALGGKFRGAVLVKVTPTEVVLRRGAASQTLKLFPHPLESAAP